MDLNSSLFSFGNKIFHTTSKTNFSNSTIIILCPPTFPPQQGQEHIVCFSILRMEMEFTLLLCVRELRGTLGCDCHNCRIFVWVPETCCQMQEREIMQSSELLLPVTLVWYALWTLPSIFHTSAEQNKLIISVTLLQQAWDYKQNNK